LLNMDSQITSEGTFPSGWGEAIAATILIPDEGPVYVSCCIELSTPGWSWL
jgi:hypothetical protein